VIKLEFVADFIGF